MQLILISGYPCSGKSHRARQLASYFTTRISAATTASGGAAPAARLTVRVIDDNDFLGVPRTAFRDARDEKTARAAFYSAVKRALARDVVVVADGLNYIKGYRYQLYCEAKAVRTPSCVVSFFQIKGVGGRYARRGETDSFRGTRRDARGDMPRDQRCAQCHCGRQRAAPCGGIFRGRGRG